MKQRFLIKIRHYYNDVNQPQKDSFEMILFN